MKGVHTVNERDKGHNLADFVGLQVPDEVPTNVCRQSFVLLQQFLYSTLAEIVLTGVIGLADEFCGMKLAHAHKRHLFR
jgi:hypothetical protein